MRSLKGIVALITHVLLLPVTGGNAFTLNEAVGCNPLKTHL